MVDAVQRRARQQTQTTQTKRYMLSHFLRVVLSEAACKSSKYCTASLTVSASFLSSCCFSSSFAAIFSLGIDSVRPASCRDIAIFPSALATDLWTAETSSFFASIFKTSTRFGNTDRPSVPKSAIPCAAVETSLVLLSASTSARAAGASCFPRPTRGMAHAELIRQDGFASRFVIIFTGRGRERCAGKPMELKAYAAEVATFGSGSVSSADKISTPCSAVVSLNTGSWTHAAQPSAGFVFRF